MPTLLFLSANPIDITRVRLDEECREIEARVSSAPANPIRVVSKWAVRAQDLQRALLENSPAVVHFSGHGDQDGQILLENAMGHAEPVTSEALADLFRTFSSSIRCVVLNACDSAEQARQLVQFIDCAIGMDGSVSDGAGIAFSKENGRFRPTNRTDALVHARPAKLERCTETPFEGRKVNSHEQAQVTQRLITSPHRRLRSNVWSSHLLSRKRRELIQRHAIAPVWSDRAIWAEE